MISTTTRLISTFSRNMNNRVPKMVSTPVNSWVKPIRSPSAKVSTSATIRLTMSPAGWLSR